MISGLWNGIMGLNTFKKALSVESNNIVNINTVGHKSNQIYSEDMMYQSCYGKGSRVQSVSKNFNQGSFKITNHNLDVTINRKGFFFIKDILSNEQFYTRAGNFKMGTDGTLQSADNKHVLGLSSIVSNVTSSDDTTIFNKNYIISLASKPISNNSFLQTINTKSTDYYKSAVSSGISGNGYKSAGSKTSDIEILITDYREKLDLYVSNHQGNNLYSKTDLSGEAKYAGYQSKAIQIEEMV